MIINIKYNKAINNELIVNYALFSRENYNIDLLKSYFSDLEIISIKEIIKNTSLKKNIISFNLNSKKKIFLINIKKNLNNYEIENLGAEFFEFIKELSIKNLFINAQTIEKENKNLIVHFLHGLKLRSYEFNIYKSTKGEKVINLNVLLKSKISKENQTKFKSIEIGTNFARDLVSEPPNVLFPKEYVNRLLKLKKFGVKVTVYNESKMQKLGMHSLLGVGGGSSKESFLVTQEW